LIEANGTPSAISAAAVTSADPAWGAITNRESRYQKPFSVVARRGRGPLEPAWGEGVDAWPSSASIAGNTTSASVAAMSATTAPGQMRPIEKRKFWGKIVARRARAATVSELKRIPSVRGLRVSAKCSTPSAAGQPSSLVAGDG